MSTKGSACFYCANRINPRVTIGEGWSYDCALGIDNSEINGGIEEIEKCEKAEPQFGFQIGGYYTAMTFEGSCDVPDSCLEWKIMSDGDFPITDEDKGKRAPIEFHICDFKQLEEFVKFWGKRLRKLGLVRDD